MQVAWQDLLFASTSGNDFPRCADKIISNATIRTIEKLVAKRSGRLNGHKFGFVHEPHGIAIHSEHRFIIGSPVRSSDPDLVTMGRNI